MRWLLIPCLVLAAPASAHDWNLRPDDTPFDAAGLAAAVTGLELVFFDDGRSRFSAGGSYSYTYSALNGGGSQFGTWDAREGSVICIAYRNGFDRCDMYVQDGARIVVLTADGGRFPVREVQRP